ncbi:DUF2269 domain-containing protein [Paenibacillus antri]|uniref:DUF2269 domain-containing protein n=1 Tax=Paenibacillus antri TaxID=2582848 RepID=A0A5R9GF41_9BACL|nr:DUF2269 domain-containing protein [Paenibacillus antri]TLS50025.1 DUF2269 domain-containing protein [Paenibacillus antri]
MKPGLRKLALTAHITFSVGWIGGVVAYLALVVTTQTSQDAQTVRAAFIAMEPIARFALVPLSAASLVTGLIMSLGTPWGLFRHYWVITKLMLTVVAFKVLLSQLEPISYLASAAADPTTDLGRLGGWGQFLHPGGGLLLLLVIMTLSTYKPRGMTRYGWRKQQEQRKG